MSRRGDQPDSSGGTTESHGDGTLAHRSSDQATSPGDSAAGQASSTDVVYVHSPSDSGEGFNVIRQRSDRLEVGELRTLKEGKPLVGELVKLTPRAEQERLFDVEVLADTRPAKPAGSGPAKVSSEAYRDNWDLIFSGSPASRQDGGDQLN